MTSEETTIPKNSADYFARARNARIWFLAVTMAGLLSPVFASDDGAVAILKNGLWSFGFENENDAWAIGGGDEDYTNGLRLSVRIDSRHIFEKEKGKAAEKLSSCCALVSATTDLGQASSDQNEIFLVDLIRQHASEKADTSVYRRAVGFQLASNIYTPSDIELPPEMIDENERPYSAWLYVGFFSEKTHINDAFSRWELDVGCIGPCAQGDSIQTKWHDLFNYKTPNGWSTQIENEVAIQGIYEYRPPIPAFFQRNRVDMRDERVWDIAPTFRGQLGNVFTSFGVGAIGRLGLGFFGLPGMRSYFSGAGIPAYNPSVFKPDSDTFKPTNDTCECLISTQAEFFAYLRAEARLVAYNATIEGGLFNNDDSPFTQDARPLVTDIEIGLVYRRARWAVSYSVTLRSTEVEAQSYKLVNHHWGSVRLTVPLGSAE